MSFIELFGPPLLAGFIVLGPPAAAFVARRLRALPVALWLAAATLVAWVQRNATLADAAPGGSQATAQAGGVLALGVAFAAISVALLLRNKTPRRAAA